MIPPKEKAEEIYMQFWNELYLMPNNLTKAAAKRISLIHVIKILELLKGVEGEDYYLQVKIEIEKL
jgi:hypothetical protein